MSEDLLQTLLVVDDEPQIIVAIERLFIDEHIKIISATSAREALENYQLGSEVQLQEPLPSTKRHP